MSNDGSGYRPSAGERRAQEFMARKLKEGLDGHGTAVPVDWGRLGGGVGDSADSGDRDRKVAAVTLNEASRAADRLGGIVSGTTVTPGDYADLTIVRKWIAQQIAESTWKVQKT